MAESDQRRDKQLQAEVDMATRNALLDRELILLHAEVKALTDKLKALEEERNNAMRYGLIILGTTVASLITFIAIALSGKGHT